MVTLVDTPWPDLAAIEQKSLLQMHVHVGQTNRSRDALSQGSGKCLRVKAYLAACVMQGAALEASLHAMCFIFPEAVKKTTVYRKKKKRGFQRKRNRALEFKYVELINIAAELSWFPPKKMVVWRRRTNVAGFVEGNSRDP